MAANDDFGVRKNQSCPLGLNGPEAPHLASRQIESGQSDECGRAQERSTNLLTNIQLINERLTRQAGFQCGRNFIENSKADSDAS